MTSQVDQAPNRLLVLPSEVLLHILECLSAQDILSCSVTCRDISALIHDSTHLQLVIELALSGRRLRHFHSRVGSQNAAKDLRDALDHSANAWKNLIPFRRAQFSLSKCMYEIAEGLFAHGILDACRECRTLEFRRLWINENEEECGIWKRYEDVGIDMADFSFDLAEDLLVLVQSSTSPVSPSRTAKRVFLRTLSENVPHPRAQFSILDSPGEEYWTECDIKVCGSILAVQFDMFSMSDTLGRLTIWDWTTGSMIMTCGNVGGYAFLSPNTLLQVVRRSYGENSVGLEETNPYMYHEYNIEVCKIDGSSSCTVVLNLPLHPELYRPLVYSARPPRDSPAFPSDMRFGPFIRDESAECLIVVHILWEDTIFISGKAILQMLDGYIAQVPQLRLKSLPWDEWGPDISFWLNARFIYSGFTCVDGSRFACITQYQRLFNADEDGFVLENQIDYTPPKAAEVNMLILDFNPRPIRQKASESQDGGGLALEWVSESDKTDQKVVTRLPFRAFQCRAARMYQDLVVVPDHLVAITASQHPMEYEVLQFFK